MIFVTVGAQMPFDRLIATIDRWAGAAGRRDVFAQIGETDLVPEHLTWAARLDPIEFREKIDAAELVISHAGMGSILTALEHNRPILVFPRRGALRETRNDHQVATAEWLAGQGRVAVALDEAELTRKLEALDEFQAPGEIQRWASDELLSTIRDFISCS